MSHPVTLLPWYQNGTLSENERAEVQAHLESCAECRAELESLSDVRAQVHSALDSDATPSPSARRRVMRNVAPQPRTSGIGEALRSLFALKWVPAAALGLIAVQGGLLLWTVGEQPAQPPVAISRDVGIPKAKLRVQFVSTATEADIRALLAQVRGEIVGGPNDQGEYTVEVLASNAERAAVKAADLRARGDLVRAAEPLPE